MILVLVVLFAWQAITSLSKYLKKGIVVQIEEKFPEEQVGATQLGLVSFAASLFLSLAQVFPTVTICPIGARPPPPRDDDHDRGRGRAVVVGDPFEPNNLPQGPQVILGLKHGEYNL